MTFVDFADDSSSRLRPDERRRSLVVVGNVRRNGALQSRNAPQGSGIDYGQKL
jgi:hypothetical protein